MKSIVVGYDGSAQAKRALDQAAALIEPDGELVVVSDAIYLDPRPGVTPRPALEYTVEFEGDEQVDRDKLLAEAKATLDAQKVKSVLVAAFGDPATAIIEAAHKHSAELVVVGVRGRNAIPDFLLGSVSTRVAHHAPCSVLLVR
jgi:nucleotide-binding universal stress UspA family protein